VRTVLGHHPQGFESQTWIATGQKDGLACEIDASTSSVAERALNELVVGDAFDRRSRAAGVMCLLV